MHSEEESGGSTPPRRDSEGLKVEAEEGVRILHASDLHLGAPLRKLPPELGAARLQECAEATLEAWHELTQLAVREKADVVTLGGDIFDRQAPLTVLDLFSEGLEELTAKGVAVVMVPGDHDPLSAPAWRTLWLPPGACLLSPAQSRFVLRRDDRVVAAVHGAGRGLPQRDPELGDGLQVGLLHAAIEGSRGGPAETVISLEDLRAGDLDAWLLGGVHERKEMGTPECPIHYPGNPQGLCREEEGARGCTLLEWIPGEPPRLRFHPLSRVVWEHVDLEVSAEVEGADGIQAALDLIAERVEAREQLVLLRIRVNGALEGSRGSFEAGLRRALDAEFGDRVVPVEIAIRALPAAARELRQEGGDKFHDALMRHFERAGEPGPLRDALLEQVTEAASHPTLYPEGNSSPEERLDRLLPLASAEAVWTLTGEG